MTPTPLPDELQDRLRRAGVTDEESFRRALENDPQLAADCGNSRILNVQPDSKI